MYFIKRLPLSQLSLGYKSVVILTCISGRATSSTMFLKSSLERAAIASSLSCTSLPFICRWKNKKKKITTRARLTDKQECTSTNTQTNKNKLPKKDGIFLRREREECWLFLENTNQEASCYHELDGRVVAFTRVSAAYTNPAVQLADH